MITRPMPGTERVSVLWEEPNGRIGRSGSLPIPLAVDAVIAITTTLDKRPTGWKAKVVQTDRDIELQRRLND